MPAAAIGAILLVALPLRTMPAMATAFDACMKTADAVDPMMRECEDQELGRQDHALNAAYASVLASLTTAPEVVAKLKQAERAWIVFRDADCDLLDNGPNDGSLDRLMRTSCIINKTKTRVSELDDLKAYFDNQR